MCISCFVANEYQIKEVIHKIISSLNEVKDKEEFIKSFFIDIDTEKYIDGSITDELKVTVSSFIKEPKHNHVCALYFPKISYLKIMWTIPSLENKESCDEHKEQLDRINYFYKKGDINDLYDRCKMTSAHSFYLVHLLPGKKIKE